MTWLSAAACFHPSPRSLADDLPLMPAIIKQNTPNELDLLDYRGH
jgi:hypothetical protein